MHGNRRDFASEPQSIRSRPQRRGPFDRTEEAHPQPR
jgi:hypothetical protein